MTLSLGLLLHIALLQFICSFDIQFYRREYKFCPCIWKFEDTVTHWFEISNVRRNFWSEKRKLVSVLLNSMHVWLAFHLIVCVCLNVPFSVGVCIFFATMHFRFLYYLAGQFCDKSNEKLGLRFNVST